MASELVRYVRIADVRANIGADRLRAVVVNYQSLHRDPDSLLLRYHLGVSEQGGARRLVLIADALDRPTLERVRTGPRWRLLIADLESVGDDPVEAVTSYDSEAERWQPLVKERWTTISELADPAHSALVVVDIQNDFCSPGGARASEEMLRQIETVRPQLVCLVEAARRINLPVVYTRSQTNEEHDTGQVYLRRSRVGLTDSTYLIPGTWGWEFCDFLKPKPGESIVTKWRHSVFTNPRMDGVLQSIGARSLLLVGVATSGCVEGAARDAFARGYYVSVVGDCTASFDAKLQQYSLRNIEQHFGQVLESHDVLAVWNDAEQPGAAPGS